MSRKSKVDFLLNRWISKKLFVFILSTIFMVFQLITSEQWFYITMLYISVQNFHDLMVNWKHGSKMMLDSSSKEENNEQTDTNSGTS